MVDTATDTGGITAPVKIDVGKISSGDKTRLMMISDLHIGASNVNYNRIKEDLDEAVESDAYIAINGDVFDAILPSDRKRFDIRALHPRLRQRQDVMTAALEMAVEVLAPYADRIVMIGCGNHETALEKHHSMDPILFLLDMLQPHHNADHQIAHGGYMGCLSFSAHDTVTKTRRGEDSPGGCQHYDIWYYHGSGGSSPVTHGIIDFNRKQSWISGFDCLWLGHKHKKPAYHGVEMSLNRNRTGYNFKDQRCVYTGAYFDTYNAQTQSSIRRNGRKTNYAADAGMAPGAQGGVMLEITWTSDRKPKSRITI